MHKSVGAQKEIRKNQFNDSKNRSPQKKNNELAIKSIQTYRYEIKKH